MIDLERTLVSMIPEVVVWGIGLYFAVKMVKRGGAVPEKLMLAGCSLMLFKTLFHPLVFYIVSRSFVEQDISRTQIALYSSLSNIPFAVVSLVGLICLVIAFWKIFISGRQETS